MQLVFELWFGISTLVPIPRRSIGSSAKSVSVVVVRHITRNVSDWSRVISYDPTT